MKKIGQLFGTKYLTNYCTDFLQMYVVCKIVYKCQKVASLLKLSNGVMDVIKHLELSSSETCQNPQFASTLLNITAPCN